MTDHIDAILFDMGGTLRQTTRREPAQMVPVIKQIMEFLRSKAASNELAQLSATSAKACRRWARQHLGRLRGKRTGAVCTLPDFPADGISRLAIRLHQIWRDPDSRRRIIPEVQKAGLTISRRGYRLGPVCDILSSRGIPRALKERTFERPHETQLLSSCAEERTPIPPSCWRQMGDGASIRGDSPPLVITRFMAWHFAGKAVLP